jgi:GNAT superfamily N-acetyltransferase
MIIVEVKTRPDWKHFHALPRRIYNHIPHWICPLESDIENIFNADKNKAFAHGEAQVFILLNDESECVGRIAVFLDVERNAQQPYPTGGIGFFECIENQAYAFQLFEHAEKMLQSKGVKAIDGPVNFGERDKFWGLLVQGFEHYPLYQEYYHPPYYQVFFEAWGFRPYEQILTLKGIVQNVPIERFRPLAARVQERFGLTVRHIDTRNLEKLATDLSTFYNETFHFQPYFKPLEFRQVYTLLKQIRPILDPKLACFVYDSTHPIGFCGLLPEVNPFMRHANGKMNALKLLWFIVKLKMTKPKPMKGLLFGVHPDFQRKGIFPLMVDFLYTKYLTDNYRDVFLATIRGHNKMMVDTCANLNVKPDRVHVAYRKMLDDTIAFEPLEFISV